MKYLFKFFVLLLALPILLSPVSAETSVDDQYCDNDEIASADEYWIINYHTVSQTFTPTMNRLTSVLLALAGGTDIAVPVKMDIYQVGGGLVLSKTVSTSSALVSWVEYTFPAVSIDITKQYRIDLTTTSDTARWIVSIVECYSGGTAIIDSVAQANQDFGFVTYGYNYVAPSVSPSPAASVSPSPSLSPTPGDIAKPISLDADFISETEGVKLIWAASSTAGIEGYNVYRSKGDNDNYINIASVESDTNIYFDEDIEEGLTYYYSVKAYIADTESPSSPVAEVAVPLFNLDEGEPNLISPQTQPSLLQSIFGQYLALGVGLIVVIIIGAMVLAYYLLEKRSKNKTSAKLEGLGKEKAIEEVPVEEAVEEKEEAPEKEEEENSVKEEEVVKESEEVKEETKEDTEETE